MDLRKIGDISRMLKVDRKTAKKWMERQGIAPVVLDTGKTLLLRYDLEKVIAALCISAGGIAEVPKRKPKRKTPARKVEGKSAAEMVAELEAGAGYGYSQA